jgi:hypothetical protein
MAQLGPESQAASSLNAGLPAQSCYSPGLPSATLIIVNFGFATGILARGETEMTAPTQPRNGFSPPAQALWWLKAGEFRLGPHWEKAHAICQTAEGTLDYDRVHALAHWIEGDETNTDYWYRRTGEIRAVSIAAEWERLAAILSKG